VLGGGPPIPGLQIGDGDGGGPPIPGKSAGWWDPHGPYPRFPEDQPGPGRARSGPAGKSARGMGAGMGIGGCVPWKERELRSEHA
jgi:hypothetical protein